MMPALPRSGRFIERPALLGPLLFAIAAIAVLALLGPWMTMSGTAIAGEGSPVRQGAYFVLFGIVVYAMRPIESPGRLLAVPLPLVVALAWCWLSIGWAIDPGIALRRLVLTTALMWTVFAAVRQAGYERTLAILRVMLVGALIANYVAVLLFPAVGTHTADEPFDRALIGDWRGIMAHKNFAGAVCALSILVYTFDAKRIFIGLRLAIIAAAAFFLFKSGSRTSLGVCVIALAVGWVYIFYNARYRMFALMSLSLAAFATGIALTIYHNPFTGHLTDASAFTGRTQIWWALSNYSADNRLLGAGYGSFWNIGPASPIYQYGRGWVIDVVSGHNGFLDMLTQIGVPGLVLVVFGACVWPLIQLFRSPAASGPRGALIFSILLFCTAHNFTESSLFERDVIVQVFMMFAIAMLWSLIAERLPTRLAMGSKRLSISRFGLDAVSAPGSRALGATVSREDPRPVS